MTARVFLDTNVLVYADDADAGQKQTVAGALVDRAIRDKRAVLSTQVLQEFFVVSTRKLKVPADVARAKVELLAKLEVVQVDDELIVEAIGLHQTHGLSFWDGLVVACARAGSCAVLVTEDLQHGQVIAGVRVENPFATS